MNKCILRVEGISLYDRPKEEKVFGFKKNHFLKNTNGERFQPLNLRTLRIILMVVYTKYSLVLNFV